MKDFYEISIICGHNVCSFDKITNVHMIIYDEFSRQSIIGSPQLTDHRL